MKITIIYGSDTGNTQSVAEQIAEKIADKLPKLVEIEQASSSDFEDADILFLGTSTWGFGDLQSGWDDFVSTLEDIDFSGKKVALFGLGDSASYADSFVSAMGTLYDTVVAKGATIIGRVATDGYDYSSSDAEKDGMFVGLPLDEDNESEQTEERIDTWLESLQTEL